MDGLTLPAGHISTEDAIKLISKHTAKNQIIDLQFLVDNIPFMNSGHNYTIKLLQKDNNGKLYSGSHVVAVVATDRDLENLKYAIKEAAKRVTGVMPEPEKKVRKITTQVDDKAGTTPKARENKKSKTHYGSKIETGYATVESVDAANKE